MSAGQKSSLNNRGAFPFNGAVTLVGETGAFEESLVMGASATAPAVTSFAPYFQRVLGIRVTGLILALRLVPIVGAGSITGLVVTINQFNPTVNYVLTATGGVTTIAANETLLFRYFVSGQREEIRHDAGQAIGITVAGVEAITNATLIADYYVTTNL